MAKSPGRSEQAGEEHSAMKSFVLAIPREEIQENLKTKEASMSQ